MNKTRAMPLDIILARLHNQLLFGSQLHQLGEVVEWLGAVQAQEYAGAKWALSQRLNGPWTDAAIDQQFNQGTILRTHVMRPTWHFVTPADILWMLELTAPRVRKTLAHIDRQLAVDRSVIKKSNTVLKKALQGGQQLMRAELGPTLEKAGISAEGLRLGHLLMHAELDGLICSGGRPGKQFTYALLEERAPNTKTLSREAALLELTRRYFRSHGPATLQDFVWWSGLTVTDARKGVEAIRSNMEQEIRNEKIYWFYPVSASGDRSATAYLLPSYDEYTVGYRDRSDIFDSSHIDKLSAFRESILTQVLLIGGEIAGTWKRTVKKDAVIVEVAPFKVLKAAQEQAVLVAAQQYGRFIQLPTVLA